MCHRDGLGRPAPARFRVSGNPPADHLRSTRRATCSMRIKAALEPARPTCLGHSERWARCRTQTYPYPSVCSAATGRNCAIRISASAADDTWPVCSRQRLKAAIVAKGPEGKKTRNLRIGGFLLAATSMNDRPLRCSAERSPCDCGILCAASARSEKTEFTGWALSRLAAVQRNILVHSYLNVSSQRYGTTRMQLQRMPAIHPPC